MKLLLTAFFLSIYVVEAGLLAQTFKEVSEKYGLYYNYPGNDHQEVGAGVSVFDVNNDGFLDFYLLNYINRMGNGYENDTGAVNSYIPFCNENFFFLNENGNNFKEISKDLGLNDLGCALAASFTDFDNDVDLILLNDFG
jgi:hypothetical protein